MTGSSGMECQMQNLAETLPESPRGSNDVWPLQVLRGLFDVGSFDHFSRTTSALLARDDGR